ncbi:MAG: amidohydrolase family protein [Selenomonadaceae bacterium]|nr:amidohydrolase family protein [Selenomonadaceae bacterium]MBQ9497686.1 amidohydrolase family protein [Selenomonadaceae bacterium]
MSNGLTRREFLKTASMAALAMAVPVEVFAAGKTDADLVVYGKIFTSENNRIAEAFAVKDGKFVYVGNKAGAKAFIKKGKTEVIDYTGKGLVMPACGNGHAHYSIGHGIPKVGMTVDFDDTPQKFMTEIVPAAVKKARDNGATAIFGFGWQLLNFEKDMPTRQQLDAICSDIPIYFADDEGHKGLANTLTLVNAGIMSKDGTVLKKGDDIRGGEIVMGEDGTPTGYLKEQAGTYTRSFLDNDKLFSVDLAREIMADIEHHLLSEGYTMYLDGWGNYFYNNSYYQAAQELDKAGNMHFVLGMTYEIESWMNVDDALAKAVDVQKYASTHVKTNWIKLFMDGTPESGTGFIEPLYLDGHQGIANWTEEEVTDITRKANSKGLTMHIHAMGNMAVNRVVNAYINGGKDEMRNTIVHLRNVNEPDYKRMADHNIYATEGMLWHHNSAENQEAMLKIFQGEMALHGYPLKSFFDNGVNVTSHSDFPALSHSPDDPFGIMEIAVTGLFYKEQASKPWWPEELITREQALTALTIAVAKQMFLENERGSIKPGKYADFLLVNKDVLTCPVKEIHTAKPAATYFEGQKVFSM